MDNIYKSLMDGLKIREKVVMVTCLNSEIQKKLFVQADLFADQPVLFRKLIEKGNLL